MFIVTIFMRNGAKLSVAVNARSERQAVRLVRDTMQCRDARRVEAVRVW